MANCCLTAVCSETTVMGAVGLEHVPASKDNYKFVIEAITNITDVVKGAELIIEMPEGAASAAGATKGTASAA